MTKAFRPRPYQNHIINHEIDIHRCNIWAGMGMGKTVATLTTLEDLFMAGAETQPALRRWRTATPACLPSTMTIWSGWWKN